MRPGIHRALPVTAATARFQTPSPLHLVAFLKIMLFYAHVGHAVLLHLACYASGNLFLLKGRDVPIENFPERG